MAGNSNWQILMRWHAVGGSARTSPKWTMRNWAVDCDTTMTRTSSIRRLESATCTVLCVICKVWWGKCVIDRTFITYGLHHLVVSTNFKNINYITYDSFCIHGALNFFGRGAGMNETRGVKSRIWWRTTDKHIYLWLCTFEAASSNVHQVVTLKHHYEHGKSITARSHCSYLHSLTPCHFTG
jgi:hypothetical protein